jgi:acyl dehydratase
VEFADVKEGMEVPSLIQDVSVLQTVMYCAVTWDFARQHYDRQYAQELGFRQPVIDPQMYGAYLSRILMGWAAPQGMLKKMRLQYRKPGFLGDKLTYMGRVTNKYASNGEAFIDCELTVENEEKQGLVNGTAVLAFEANDDDRVST